MATATVTRRETEVTVKMTEEEARALLAVLARVGGCPDNSPRKHAGSVYQAVRDGLGLRFTSGLSESQLLDGDLFFRSGR